MHKNLYFIPLLSIFLTFLLCLTPGGYAQDGSPEVAQESEQSGPMSEPQEAPAAEITPPNAGPKLKELEEYTAALLNGLETYQAKYIYNIRQEFGLIRSIQVARSDIENAVNSCGEKNPDMKSQMEERFNAWSDAIVPKLAVADVALKDAIQRQGFRPTVRVTMLLDLVQAAFEERDADIKKIPVTTAEACQSLLKSMDETEKSLIELLDVTIDSLNKLSIDPQESADLKAVE